MMSREFDAECARALGLEIIHEAWPVGVPPDGCSREAALNEDDDSYWWRERAAIYKRVEPREAWDEETRGQLGLWCEPVPRYSTDYAAARLLENEVEKRGLEDAYVQALIAIVLPNGSSVGAFWLLIRATPEARARAFLEAVK